MGEIVISNEGFPERATVTPAFLVREARERWELAATAVTRGHVTPGVERQQHLVYALALMVEKLAEGHRRELDEVVARVKRLEVERENDAMLRTRMEERALRFEERPYASHEAHVDLEARVTRLEHERLEEMGLEIAEKMVRAEMDKRGPQ